MAGAGLSRRRNALRPSGGREGRRGVRRQPLRPGALHVGPGARPSPPAVTLALCRAEHLFPVALQANTTVQAETQALSIAWADRARKSSQPHFTGVCLQTSGATGSGRREADPRAAPPCPGRPGVPGALPAFPPGRRAPRGAPPGGPRPAPSPGTPDWPRPRPPSLASATGLPTWAAGLQAAGRPSPSCSPPAQSRGRGRRYLHKGSRLLSAGPQRLPLPGLAPPQQFAAVEGGAAPAPSGRRTALRPIHGSSRPGRGPGPREYARGTCQPAPQPHLRSPWAAGLPRRAQCPAASRRRVGCSERAPASATSSLGCRGSGPSHDPAPPFPEGGAKHPACASRKRPTLSGRDGRTQGQVSRTRELVLSGTGASPKHLLSGRPQA